jgi:hypothetical protein
VSHPAAGGIGAIVRSLPDWVQITFGFIAFVGAFLSAASGTIRPPEKADVARVRRIQLEAYARRLHTFISVDLQHVSSQGSDEVRQILETALRSLEEIGEVQLPRALEEFVSMGVVPRRLSSDGAKGAPASARPSALPDPVAITARP